jgi:hypothetical protein
MIEQCSAWVSIGGSSGGSGSGQWYFKIKKNVLVKGMVFQDQKNVLVKGMVFQDQKNVLVKGMVFQDQKKCISERNGISRSKKMY